MHSDKIAKSFAGFSTAWLHRRQLMCPASTVTATVYCLKQAKKIQSPIDT